MSALEVQSVLQKMAAMREAAGHWLLGAEFEFQKLYTALEKVHAKVLHAEPLVDSRSSAAYSSFIADLRRVALVVDDALDKFSSSASFSSRARRKLLMICFPYPFRQSRQQILRNVNAGTSRQPTVEQTMALELRPKIAKQFEEAHRDLQMLLRLFSTYVADLLPQEIVSDVSSREQEVDPDAFCHKRFIRPFCEKPRLIGRDKDTGRVLKIIEDSKTKVVAIVGMAGVGKTALMRNVYSAVSVSHNFHYRMWVEVSQDFSPETIFRSVMNLFSELLNGEDPESSWLSIKQGLVDEKYLLVLDNVWNEDPGKWSQLLHLLTSEQFHGSKIIVTTRIPAAAAAIPSVKKHNLLPLSVEDSLELLMINTSDVDRSIRKVAERCSGLPKLVGFFKSSLENRELPVPTVEKFDLQCRDDLGLLRTAKASYNHLPPYLQRCFLYCSLFPLDHIFETEEMTSLWVAEGLTHVSIREAQVIDDVSKLLNECFDVLDKSGSRGPMRCKMQYILHNLARNKGEGLYKAMKIEDCSNLSEDSVRYMSLMVDHTTKELPVSLNEQKDLRTLILLRKQEMVLFCQKSEIREIPSDYCRYLTALRVLDLHATRIEKLPYTFDMLSNLRYLNLSQTDIAELPESFEKLQYLIYLNIAQTRIAAVPEWIGRIKSLRYLNLSQTVVRKLPDSIGYLRLLQTLQLSHCEKLFKLPQSIAFLTSLQKLDLEGCHYLSEMPLDISNMKNLRELNTLECSSLDQMPRGLSALTKIEALPRYIATEGNEGTILELQGLRNMKRLGLECLDRVSLMDAKEICLKEKNKLENLTLHWNSNSGTELLHNSVQTNQGNICSDLEHLHGGQLNQGNSSSDVEQQGDGLQPNQGNSSSDVEQQRDGLQSIEGSSRSGVENLVDSLQPNEDLKTLEIISYGGRSFPLWLPSGLPNLVQIRLVNLNCEILPPLGQMSHLETVEISGMNAIKHVSKELNPQNRNTPKLKKLTFSQMLNLESWPEDDGALFDHLEELSIIQCPNFKRLSMTLPIEKLTVWMSPHELLSKGLTGVASKLKSISISLCEELSSSGCEGLIALSKLEELEISGCDELESLPLGMEDLTKLKKLSVIGCSKFDNLSNLEGCTALRSLCLSGCPKLRSLKSVPETLRWITTCE